MQAQVRVGRGHRGGAGDGQRRGEQQVDRDEDPDRDERDALAAVWGERLDDLPALVVTVDQADVLARAAPALLKLGVPLIVSHMFVFYFGIMADLTPPVALAAFAAASTVFESAMPSPIADFSVMP